MKKGFFITGTDTGVGKTWATLYLMNVLRGRGCTVAGMKPVATGALPHEGRWVNEDAMALLRASSLSLPYEEVNPYVFEPPVSPHIAARLTGRTIEIAHIVNVFRGLSDCADCVLVEGIGGWRVPLNDREQVADLAVALGLPIILVVGVRLGCLNHALLSYEAIERSDARCAGWIANRIVRDFPYAAETIETLRTALSCPLLAELPYCASGPPPFPDVFREPLSDETLRVLASYVTFCGF